MTSDIAPPFVTRFAPAPTGYLHLGHVRNALEVWRFARAHRARVLLRIEDHDRQRCRPDYEAAIREDLEWLGFQPDAEAPRQSTRGAVYREWLARIDAQGLAFGCVCSREDVRRAGPGDANDIAAERRYPGTCRDAHIGLRDDVGVRVRMEPGIETFDDLRAGAQHQDPSRQCGDVLVRDRHGNWTYQFAVTVDDYLQGITHVIRGEDLLSSTGRQIRLARLLGRAAPPAFLHHALVMRDASHKLSKSDGDTGVRELRARGLRADDVRALAEAPQPAC